MTIAALAATSCSSDEPQEDTAASSADKGDNKGGEETKADPTQQAIDAYKDVLDNPEKYERDFSDRDDYYPTGTYSYALIEANNDEVPELLLKNDCKEFSPVTFIAIGKDGKPFASDIALVTGAGSTGSRANVVASGEGDGIFEWAYSSGRPEVPTTHYDFDGKQLTMGERSEWSQVTGAPADQIELEWYATADASGLKKNQSGPNFGSGESSGKSENKEKKSKKNKGRKPKPDLPAGYVKKDDADNDAPASANKNLPEGAYSKAGGPIPSDALEATVVRRYKESYMHDRAVFQSPSGKIKCAIDASFAGVEFPLTAIRNPTDTAKPLVQIGGWISTTGNSCRGTTYRLTLPMMEVQKSRMCPTAKPFTSATMSVTRNTTA
ncbi:hypothetical protein ACN4DP_04105 [Corynebacterium macclintockiae]|uniref:hypothetical protein n=1 Tax=Corynebacterium macclintockiae TaxID=2913501 RepID=UPI003EC114F0